MHDAYPLSWPPGFPRTEPHRRRRAAFGAVRLVGNWNRKDSLTVHEATTRLLNELAMLGAGSVVVSTNMRVRQDGLTASKQRLPEDPGVAVYFTLDGRPHAMPCDRWNRVADNIAAVAKHIDALRGMDRWGVGDLARAFAGYQALPPPAAFDWRRELGVDGDATLENAEERYRASARQHHPDAGGDTERMAILNRAIADARKELGS